MDKNAYSPKSYYLASMIWVVSFIMGLILLAYLEVTKPESYTERPIKRTEEVEVKYRFKEYKPTPSITSDTIDFEEVK